MESYIHILHSISYIYVINIYKTTCLSSNNILLLYICNILRRETYIYIHKSIYCRFGHVLLTYFLCIVIVNLGVFVKKTCRYIHISIKICRNAGGAPLKSLYTSHVSLKT